MWLWYVTFFYKEFKSKKKNFFKVEGEWLGQI